MKTPTPPSVSSASSSWRPCWRWTGRRGSRPRKSCVTPSSSEWPGRSLPPQPRGATTTAKQTGHLWERWRRETTATWNNTGLRYPHPSLGAWWWNCTGSVRLPPLAVLPGRCVHCLQGTPAGCFRCAVVSVMQPSPWDPIWWPIHFIVVAHPAH